MKEKLMKLIDVKSIMTLLLTIGFIFFTARRDISGEQFNTIFNIIVAFYFGTQATKITSK